MRNLGWLEQVLPPVWLRDMRRERGRLRRADVRISPTGRQWLGTFRWQGALAETVGTWPDQFAAARAMNAWVERMREAER
jgi:hypothetical protein